MFAKSLVSIEARQRALAAIAEDKDTPTLLYGAGIYADEVRRFLLSHSVNVVGCFVDKRYRGEQHVCNLPVFPLEHFQSIYKAFNVVIAFCGHPSLPRSRLEELQCPQIRSVRFYDCRFWERFIGLGDDIANRLDSYEKMYEWLEDARSQATFISYIDTKLTYEGGHLATLQSSPQYFPDDLPQFVPRPDDVFVDGGAYIGDTLAVALSKTQPTGCHKYYAFEPDKDNAAKLAKFITSHNLRFAEIVPRGLWSHPDILRFHGTQNTRSLITDSGEVEIAVDSIDHLGLEASFVKMDIEGAELAALKGSAETIRKRKPRLAIALYHKPQDLLEIPAFVKSLCPEYRFYLRIHSPMSEELVLYATAE